MAMRVEWPDQMTMTELTARSQVLGEPFYARPSVEVARDLLGKVIVHGAAAGRVVEVEAYLGLEDLAAHAAAGITQRTKVLFGPPGRAYVYLIYGIHECLNLVAEPDGTAGCVLIRALEPICGLGKMQRRRPAARQPTDLCSGPGKLTQALGITRKLNGADVTGTGELSVRALFKPLPVRIAATPRIGITKCADWPLRFLIQGNRFVSR